MFQILIADDEALIRQGLAAILQRGLDEEIQWLEAVNGQEALELVEKNNVDLIITDICMPLCSGLEFVEKLRQEQENMMVIIISGYANFEYAKQAVRLGVQDYITKPINKEELLSLVRRCLQEIGQKQQAVQRWAEEKQKLHQMTRKLQQEALCRLLENGLDENCRQLLQNAEWTLEGTLFLCGVMEYERLGSAGQDAEILQFVEAYLHSKQMEGRLTIYHSGCLAALWEGEAADKIWNTGEKSLQDLCRQVERKWGVRVFWGLGDLVYLPERIPQSFQQSRQASGFKLWNPPERVFFFRNLAEEKEQPPILTRSLLENWKLEDAERMMQSIRSCMAQGYSWTGLQQLSKAYALAADMLSEKERENLPAFADIWDAFALRREFNHIFSILSSRAEEESGSSPMSQEIIRYTLEHITEDIDLNALAYHFGKTPGYIGKLFRQENQMGFNEFVTKERMKLAQRLLKDPALSIQKVSKMCGYYNSKYFSVVFKKVTGMTPKAYRIQVLKT